jgi:uracil-DNA glycosylase family 4
MPSPLAILERQVTQCRLCPRLVAHREQVAAEKRRAYRDWTYWGRPVPSFGDPNARLLIVGLAPAAHGANRTGRMFTGDRSGDFLYRALFETGFASQPTSVQQGDGLELRDAFISASVRCAPPDNKPTREEFETCRRYLAGEVDLLKNVQTVVALGKLAFDNYLTVAKQRGAIPSLAAFTFGHNRAHPLPPGWPLVISSYHPSQQNTSTGKLTAAMLRDVFEHARSSLK